VWPRCLTGTSGNAAFTSLSGPWIDTAPACGGSRTGACADGPGSRGGTSSSTGWRALGSSAASSTRTPGFGNGQSSPCGAALCSSSRGGARTPDLTIMSGMHGATWRQNPQNSSLFSAREHQRKASRPDVRDRTGVPGCRGETRGGPACPFVSRPPTPPPPPSPSPPRRHTAGASHPATIAVRHKAPPLSVRHTVWCCVRLFERRPRQHRRLPLSSESAGDPDERPHRGAIASLSKPLCVARTVRPRRCRHPMNLLGRCAPARRCRRIKIESLHARAQGFILI
jgi:hypothetical protein